VTRKVVINPVERVHGNATLTLELEEGVVVRARSTSLYFRGFEKILEGRDPRDAPYLTQRICGICSAAHGVAAALALEDTAKVEVPQNGLLLRNIAFAADVLMNHITFMYMLALPDYFRGPPVPPLVPNPITDYRLPQKQNQRLVESYSEAMKMRILAHELAGLLSSKAPHQHGLIAGGFPLPPTAERVMASLSMVARLRHFLNERLWPDLEIVAEFYPEYWLLGRGYGRLLAFPSFRVSNTGKVALAAGRVENRRVLELDPKRITEDVTRSWYSGTGTEKPEHGSTKPEPGKEGAYSWIKAPRYDGKAYETGPLARMWVNGYWRRGISTLDRLFARAKEALLLTDLTEEWLRQLKPGEPTYRDFKVPKEATGVGLTGAMRGALGHWVMIKGGRIAHYQIITPSAWNYSPADATGQPGPVEKALEGTRVRDPENPTEAGRILRSFDPCYSCAVHMSTAHGTKLWRVF
jgi:hydrogenase large subunit